VATRVILHDAGLEWTAEVDRGQVTLGGVEAPVVVRDEPNGGLRVDGLTEVMRGAADLDGRTAWVSVNGCVFAFEVTTSATPVRTSGSRPEGLTPPMSATVVRIHVRPGDRVEAGDPLVVLEAMKMELPIRAPRDATVRAVHCREGELVQPEMILVELE
jgi:3-methylcrotonyl-CoA carboxylase alpha subunit